MSCSLVGTIPFFTIGHDLRGNIRTCSVSISGSPSPPPQPIDLPDEMMYDSHNRLTEYIVTDDRKVRLHYDPVGRVFRKEIFGWVSEDWELEKAIHYYYQGSALVQEYVVTVESETTAVADIEWDYLRGVGGRVIRRRETDGATVTDTLHVNAPIGTVMQEAEPYVTGEVPPGTPNGYVTNADGEPFWVDNLEPTTENHIQYHGGFLEDKEFHTSEANQERGYFYRMGVRHYSPMLGRFLQKDPMTISRLPSKRSPLSANPYTYALNRPLQLSDTSGFQPELPGLSNCSTCGGGSGGGGLDGPGGSSLGKGNNSGNEGRGDEEHTANWYRCERLV
ncbi:MAG: RHS repeat-associated core domain-containing protein [bacterium]